MSAAEVFNPDELKRAQSLIRHSYLVDRELGSRSFRDFAEMSWHVVEPGTRFVPNWHLDAITDHCQAVAERDIGHLLVNIPPRNTKSTLISVLLHPWIWTWAPSETVMSASHVQPLAERDSRKSRLLIQSPWYQQRWGHVYQLAGDQNAKRRYENNRNGSRLAISVDKGVGEGGNLILVDDPHDMEESNSPTALATVIRWWSETMTSRLNDPIDGRFIIIMQRVHENDLSGHVLAKELGWEHLNLPMEYEAQCVVEVNHRCSQAVVQKSETTGKKEVFADAGTSLGFRDPRSEEGELLNPDRFPRAAVDGMKAKMGSYASAGHLQQRPGPRKGGMFQVDLIRTVAEVPPNLVKVHRAWDKAATDGGGCNSAGVKLGRYDNGRFIILHSLVGQWSSHGREAAMLAQARVDGHGCSISHEQEPGSSGKDSALATSRNLAEFNVKGVPATGNKVFRAEPLAAAIERGDVDLLEGSWNQELLDELRLWPASKRLDQGDALAAAYNELALGGMSWRDLYPPDSVADSSDGLGFLFEGDTDFDGGDEWAAI